MEGRVVDVLPRFHTFASSLPIKVSSSPRLPLRGARTCPVRRHHHGRPARPAPSPGPFRGFEEGVAFAPTVAAAADRPIAFVSVSAFRPDQNQGHGGIVVGFDLRVRSYVTG